MSPIHTIQKTQNKHIPYLVPLVAAFSLLGAPLFSDAMKSRLFASDSAANMASDSAVAAITPATSFAPVVKKVAPSVVTISTSREAKRMKMPENQRIPDEFRRFFDFGERQPRQRDGIGSGVIISPDGYILTNNHVIAGADTITVALVEGKEKYTAKLVGADEKSDLAVLKIDAEKSLPAIMLGDSDKVEVGDVVLAVGNPFGVGQTVTSGIVSARGRGVGLADYEDFIQTDASINPGNSGGALVDTHGRLIGINTAILSPNGGNLGIGFAVPVNLAKNIKDSLITNGKVVRGYLGVLLQPLTPELAEAFAIKDGQGVLIGDAPADGPAAQAGVKSGDVLIGFNNKPVEDIRQLRLRAAQAVPGTQVDLDIMRDGKPLRLSVKVGTMPGEPMAHKKGEADKAADKTKLGVRLGELDQETRERFEIPEHISGVVIHEVMPDSRADKAGIKPGTVIMEINRTPISKAKEVAPAIAQSEGDILLRIFAGQTPSYVVIKQEK
jgi:serine protease Do